MKTFLGWVAAFVIVCGFAVLASLLPKAPQKAEPPVLLTYKEINYELRYCRRLGTNRKFAILCFREEAEDFRKLLAQADEHGHITMDEYLSACLLAGDWETYGESMVGYRKPWTRDPPMLKSDPHAKKCDEAAEKYKRDNPSPKSFPT